MRAAALPPDCDVLALMEALWAPSVRGSCPRSGTAPVMRYFHSISSGSALRLIPPEQVRKDAESAAAGLFKKSIQP